MRPKSILIADDDEALLRVLSIRCKDMGVEIRQATDAMQALVRIHEHPPDLVILDVNMPGGDGLSVCQMLSTDKHLSDIPVILLTGQSGDQILKFARTFKAHYVAKSPECWKQLRPLICKLLGIKDEASDFPPARHAKSAAPAPPRTRSNGKLVLIVEDDPAVSRAVSVRLQANGYRTICDRSGSAALSLAKEHCPDLITLDVCLPCSDGLGLMQIFKAHPLTTNIPVIVVTGEKEEGLQEMFTKMGAADFLSKPFSTLDLLKAVESALADKVSGGATGSRGKNV